MAFAKGHGTENDFVLLTDSDGELDLTPSRVQALCDRHRGLGADGVLRVVRAGALGERVGDGIADDDWFMDYRNADGSVAEMCGNGVRVFAHHLHAAGLDRRNQLVVGSRSGPRPVTVHAAGAVADVTVHMGAARSAGTSTATVDGRLVTGLVVDVGNPHLACLLSSTDEVAALDLTEPPGFDDAVFPHGVNVELFSPPVDGAVTMRVYERGVGETRSCGTGVVATALAALHSSGTSTGELVVHVPGGAVRAGVSTQGTWLRGPSVLVARGVIDAAWWAAHA
ncbi:MAG: diaminopimelate epimerase [Mycobacteriaceae bacterium]